MISKKSPMSLNLIIITTAKTFKLYHLKMEIYIGRCIHL